MLIETMLSTDHIELIKIFIDANELRGMTVLEAKVDIRGTNHSFIHLACHDEDTMEKITFMSLRHSGFLNMFDDYLMKCGVTHNELNPATYRRQLQKEREDETTRIFMKNTFGVNESDDDEYNVFAIDTKYNHK